MPGYWPQMPQLSDGDTVVLSRFAYLRRRGNEIVLELPRAAALFRICDPKLLSLVAMLSAPQPIRQLRQKDGFPGIEVLALLADCQIVLKTDPARESNPRLAEGDQDLALWDFHDLLFHARSTEGRHANPVGGVFPHGGTVSPLPALRPSWPGEKIDLCAALASNPEAPPQIAKLLRQSPSTRDFDDRKPITLTELSRFLDGAVRALPRPAARSPSRGPSHRQVRVPSLSFIFPFTSAKGLLPAFITTMRARTRSFQSRFQRRRSKRFLRKAQSAMGVTAPPQILITIAARFGRVSWKYSSIAYSLILKDAGVLTQTLYLMASGMGLGGCAIGIANIDQFEKMTGIGFHIEGAVGQFAIGRPLPPAGQH